MLLLRRERIKPLSHWPEARNASFLPKGRTSHFVCLCAYFCVLRVELRTAKSAFVSPEWCPVPLWKGKKYKPQSLSHQAQFFLCPKSLVNFCTQSWPFKASQTDRARLPVVQKLRYEVEGWFTSKRFFIFLASKLNSDTWNHYYPVCVCNRNKKKREVIALNTHL